MRRLRSEVCSETLACNCDEDGSCLCSYNCRTCGVQVGYYGSGIVCAKQIAISFTIVEPWTSMVTIFFISPSLSLSRGLIFISFPSKVPLILRKLNHQVSLAGVVLKLLSVVIAISLSK
ncbi:hypothetical protein Bca4012_011515 [Brassica carinata]